MINDEFWAERIILVMGIGCGGNNAVNNMIEMGMKGISFIAASTDSQDLEASLAPVRLHLGKELCKGLGAGSNPDVGRSAALEGRVHIKELLNGFYMVFVVAGMGGGTGTGAAPVVAEVAKEVGALAVAVVTTPLEVEGKPRMSKAMTGVEELKKVVDSIILIPGTKLHSIKNATIIRSLKKADEMLSSAVQCVVDLIIKPGLIGLDVADIRKVMSEMGLAMMGVGQASGDNRCILAMEKAVKNSPLYELPINEARKVIINITAPLDITMDELDDVRNYVCELVHEDAEIIWGCIMDEAMGQQVRVSIIASREKK